MWHLPTKSGLMRSFLKANELDQIFLKRKKGFLKTFSSSALWDTV